MPLKVLKAGRVTAALAPLLGPYFPPDWEPPPPTVPEQPGILLLLAALGVVVALVVRDVAGGRQRAAVAAGSGRAELGPTADGLTVTWLPIDAATLAELAMTEELAFGRHRRGRLPRPKDAPVDG